MQEQLRDIFILIHGSRIPAYRILPCSDSRDLYRLVLYSGNHYQPKYTLSECMTYIRKITQTCDQSRDTINISTNNNNEYSQLKVHGNTHCHRKLKTRERLTDIGRKRAESMPSHTTNTNCTASTLVLGLHNKHPLSL